MNNTDGKGIEAIDWRKYEKYLYPAITRTPVKKYKRKVKKVHVISRIMQHIRLGESLLLISETAFDAAILSSLNGSFRNRGSKIVATA